MSRPTSSRRAASGRLLAVLAAVGLLALGIGVSPASAASLPVAAAAATGTGSITGRVTVPVGFDVTKIRVRVDDPGTWDTYTEADVRADGTYTVGGLPTGSFRVQFDAYGTVLASEYWQNTYDPELPTLVAVTDGRATANINATLEVGASISGRATVPAGVDVTKVSVQIRSLDTSFNRSIALHADGTYSHTGLPPGRYHLNFLSPSTGLINLYWPAAYSTLDAGVVTVTAGQAVTGIDVALSLGGSISGTVRVPAGVSAAGIGVRAALVNGPIALQGNGGTRADGTYTVTGLIPGTYMVFFSADGTGLIPETYDDAPTSSAATLVTVTGSNETRGIDATLALGGSIAGKVTVPAGYDPTRLRVYASGDSGSGSAPVAADGTYEVKGLSTGQYRVEFVANDTGLVSMYYPSTLDPSAATEINVTIGQRVTGINGTLVVGGRITGTVTVPAGFSAGDVWVSAYEPFGNASEGAPVRSDGTYTIVGLPTGAYTVQFSPGYRSDLAAEFWNDAVRPASATPVRVTAPGTTASINAALVRGASLSGTVTVPPGYAVTSVSVAAIGHDGEPWLRTQPAADGTYSFRGLPAGTYTVHATPTDRALTERYSGNAFTYDAAERLDLTGGADRAGVNLDLVVGGTMTGTASLPAGYTWYCVDVVDTWYQVTDRSCVNAGQPYELRGLGTGRYALVGTAYRTGGNTVGLYHAGVPGLSDATRVPAAVGQASAGPALDLRGATAQGSVTPSVSVTVAPTAPNVGTAATATVRVTGASGTPTGWAEVWSGRTFLGSARLTSGAATVPVVFALGERSVHTVYRGDATYKPGSATADVALTGSRTASRTTVASSVSPVVQGEPVTATATVSALMPTGSVTFTRADGSTIGTAELVGGKASVDLPALPVGSHVITATYSGNRYHGASSGTLTQVVSPPPPPVVSAVEPPSGSVLGGTRVVLRGNWFDGATAVTFGGVRGTNLQVVSRTELAVTAPAGTGAASVVVTTPSGAGTASAGRFTYTQLVTQAPVRGVADWTVPSGQVRCQQVAGTNGVPAQATGVIVNVTTVRPNGPGYVVVYPDTAGTGATAPPGGSTVNFEPGADVANGAFVALPANGRICYATRGAPNAGVLVDVSGFTLNGSGIVTQPSQRLVDTRVGSRVGPVAGPVQPHRVYTVDVAGQAGVPDGATAVLLNVTVAEVGTIGNLRVFPGGAAVPGTSVLNYAPGHDKANAAIVALGTDGTVSFWSDTAGTAQVILDVVGYVAAGSAYTGTTPTRVMDTREASTVGPIAGALTPGRVYSLPVRGVGPVPAAATAVVLNVTAIGPTALGNLRVYPDSDGTGTTPPPGSSSINYIPGRDIPNQVIVSLPSDGRVNFYSDTGGTVHLAVDVAGYITGATAG